MRPEIATGFPVGEIGARFNMIRGNLREGEFVYVRFEIRRSQPSDLDCFLARMRMSEACGTWASYKYDWIPRSQIVCREPEAMEADNGMVRGIE